MNKIDIYHENKTHSQGDFPFNIYLCHIPKNVYEVGNHHHAQCEIIVVKSGVGIVFVNLEKIEVGKGDIIFVPPNTLHSIYQKNSEEMDYETIIFHPKLVLFEGGTLEYDIESFQTVIRRESEIYESIENCIKKIDEFSDIKPIGYQLMIKSALCEIFYHLNCNEKVDGAKANKTALSIIKKLVLYVGEHYFEDISIASISKEMGYSQSRFMALFKEYMGTTFTKYLADIRLGHAKMEILQTNEKITKISQNCGFANISYFNRLFKEKYGKSPTDFRNEKC